MDRMSLIQLRSFFKRAHCPLCRITSVLVWRNEFTTNISFCHSCEGSFGKVLQVRNRHSSKIFAMKVISKRLIKRKGSYVENILAERNILSKIVNHPFIVPMHASFQTREKLFIIMDFCAGKYYICPFFTFWHLLSQFYSQRGISLYGIID